MENPRQEKVAVVDEIKTRFDETSAVLVTEYRGLNVANVSQLRRELTAAGGEYKVYKNTLVSIAARASEWPLEEMLTGPTAIAFVTTKPDGSPGDAVDVAKVLRDFAKSNPALVVKGGVLGGKVLSSADAKALADIAPREELLARLAGGFAAPMTKFAGLLQALPRNFAYGLSALIEAGGASDAPAATTDTDQAASAAAPESSEAPEAAEAPQDAEAPEAPAQEESVGAADADTEES
ncbi:MAG: 50S ribosomal protein L10 [Acidimicrobiia bacterium]